MTAYRAAIPSHDQSSAFEALRQLLDGATRVRAAIAFVTTSGVDVVEQVIANRPHLTAELVARGAPVTDPDALVRVADHGVAVSVVTGAQATHFHPKIWLVDRPDGLHVLAGSGNLTAGGLRDNREQFELLRVAPSDEAARATQEVRFSRLTRDAVPLAVVRDSRYWSAWKQQLAERGELASRQRQLDEALLRAAEASMAVEALYRDLIDLYERAKAEVRIPAADGGTRPYVASYFKRAIDQSRGTYGPVPVVARMVKRPTEGFHQLAEAGRPDLMVETLVLDSSKPYHRLFDRTTVAHAKANIDSYRRE